MRKIFCIAIVMYCFVVHAEAQKVDDAALVDSIKAGITQFFIKKNFLDESKVRGSLNFVFATEIKQKRSIGYDANGIYRIGIYQSHSAAHILIKQKNEFRIFDLEEIGKVLKEVISYSEKNIISTEIMLVYVKEVMDIYEGNHKADNFKLNKLP